MNVLVKSIDEAYDELVKAGKKGGYNPFTRHATSLRNLANRTRRMAQREYGPGSGDDSREMISMFNQDARDYEKIAEYIEQGKIRQAASKADAMDTAARDEIPETTWNFLVGSEDVELRDHYRRRREQYEQYHGSGRVKTHYRKTKSGKASIVKEHARKPKGPFVAAKRGGKVIGKTSTGKDIHSRHSSISHASFNPKEHLEAAKLHKKLALKAKNMDEALKHLKRARRHERSAGKKDY